MRVVLQRVSSASVTIGGRVTGQIGPGLLLFVGIEAADTPDDGAWLARKIVNLRIFADDNGRMNLSIRDLDTASVSHPSALNSQLPRILVISQFTLHASTRKGMRPSFNQAAQPGHARPLYEQFVTQLSAELGPAPGALVPGSPGQRGSPAERVQTGEFGAYMEVALVNDGPVTLSIDSKLRE